MDSSEVPKWVTDKLLEEERVLSKVSYRNADYFATDKRLLRFRGKSDYEDLDYEGMTITLNKYGGGWLVLRGVLLLGGLFLPFAGFFITGGLYGLFLIAVGPLCVYSALTERYAYYQIDRPGLDSADRKKWRFDRKRWGAGKLNKFAEIVKERSDSING